MYTAHWRERRGCPPIEETDALAKTTCQSLTWRRPGERSNTSRMRNTLAHLTIRRPQQQQGIVCPTRHHSPIWGPAYRSYCLLVARKKQPLCEHPRRFWRGHGVLRYHSRWSTAPCRKCGCHTTQEASERTAGENTPNQKGSSIDDLTRGSRSVCGDGRTTGNWRGWHCGTDPARCHVCLRSFQDKTRFREQMRFGEAH